MTFIKTQTRVEASGDPDSLIAIIGEAPGSYEVRDGKPFVGPAGGVLEQCLHAAGILRSECYLTNLFKVRIQKKKRQNKSDIYLDGELLWHYDKGFTEAAQPHIEELENELKESKANVFVPLGNPATEACTGKRFITRQRGSILPARFDNKRKCVPTIHPSATLQSGDFLARYYIIFDFGRVAEERASPAIEYPKQTFIIEPTFEEVLSNLEDYYVLGKSGQRVNFDIEIINQEVSAISFACDIHRAVSVPFDNRWTPGQEVELWKAVTKILEDKAIGKVNQNILFDTDSLLFRNKILCLGRLDDPMTAINLIYPDFPKGLDFITSVYTKIPYYKDEGKIWFKGMGTDPKKFYNYNCQDSAVSAQAMIELDKELDKEGYRDLYEETMQIYEPCAAMMYRGIRADQDKLNQIKVELETKRDELQEQLNQMCGRELNVKSTPQKVQYFYVEKNIKPYLKNGRPTADEKAMVKLAKGTATRPPIPEAQLAVDITKIRSALEKYFEVVLDDDNRLRCQINPRGTSTGRLSTGKRLITNSGVNMQTLTEEFKQVLFADPGYVLVELDKKQAEWVIVAYCSGDARMINVVEEGGDPHAITGSLITGLSDIQLIRAESNRLGHETNPETIRSEREQYFRDILSFEEGGGYVPRHMSIRQLGKKSNHGGNYGMGYRRCAREWEIPEYEAKKILPLYHQAYPGVRNGFQDDIIKQLSKDRTITNYFGRKRRFLNRVDWKNRSSKVFEQAFGFLPQSTVADLINRGMIKIYNDVEYPMNLIELLMQIHDSILFQFPIDMRHYVERSYPRLAEAIIKSVNYLNPELEYGGRKFHIDTELKIGFCWGQMKEVPLDTDAGRLAQSLSKVLRGF